MVAAEAAPRLRSSPTLLTILYLAIHGAVFFVSSAPSPLYYLDSIWYAHIATNGYVPLPGNTQAPGAVFAFFPVWPGVLRVLHRLAGASVPVPVLGALLSALLFAAVLQAMGRAMAKRQEAPTPWLGLAPLTPLGLWLFAFSPGSWVFVTNHTEALFLALSWSALVLASGSTAPRAWLGAAVLAGLSALTRNQGMLVALTVGCLQLRNTDGARWGRRFGRFVGVGVVAGGIAALWPLYQWWRTGSPLASVAAQASWHHVENLPDYFDAVIWLSDANFAHAVVFWLTVAIGAWLLARGGSAWPLGLYCLLSALLWPMQGINFAQAYRFGAVLFPVWFVAGDRLARAFSRHHERRRPRLRAAAMCMVLMGITAWAVSASRAYFCQSGWPY